MWIFPNAAAAFMMKITWTFILYTQLLPALSTAARNCSSSCVTVPVTLCLMQVGCICSVQGQSTCTTFGLLHVNNTCNQTIQNLQKQTKFHTVPIVLF